MGPEQFIHSYVVSINNQYLVKNETNYDILVCPSGPCWGL